MHCGVKVVFDVCMRNRKESRSTRVTCLSPQQAKFWFYADLSAITVELFDLIKFYEL